MNIYNAILLTSVDSTTWRVSVWLVFASEHCTQIIAWCAFSVKFKKKSNTAVALRRSGSKIPCIPLVSFSNVYYEYFRKLMWLSVVLELLNITRQSKQISGYKYELYRTKHKCIV